MKSNSKKEFERLALRKIELRSRLKRGGSSTGVMQERGMIVVFLDEMDSLISRVSFVKDLSFTGTTVMHMVESTRICLHSDNMCDSL